MEKQDIEKDLKALDVQGPSSGFASRVTMKAVQELEKESVLTPWMNWIPRLCTIGFVVVFLVFLFLMVRYFSLNTIHPNVFLALKVIGFVGIAFFLFYLMDRALKRVIVG
ncbi:hypothetical protein [Ekhidna sp.]|uniref:hypothetical protein n=1 Tax=Ekhidna sp. TaxID=2608089 RepID=UPI003CCBB912